MASMNMSYFLMVLFMFIMKSDLINAVGEHKRILYDKTVGRYASESKVRKSCYHQEFEIYRVICDSDDHRHVHCHIQNLDKDSHHIPQNR